MADNDDRAVRMQALCGVEHMGEQRLASEPVQDFRPLGTHTLPKTGGENDDREVLFHRYCEKACRAMLREARIHGCIVADLRAQPQILNR
jgi:hypothetical protein